MLFEIKFKNQEKEIFANSLLQCTDIVNRYIKTESISSFPVSRNIVANWSSRSKSDKYCFVEIKKLGKKDVLKG
jgi:hypothetical protein